MTLARESLGAEADEQFCRACHGATGGNPLFLRELLRALEAAGIAPSATAASAVQEVGPAAVSRFVLHRLDAIGASYGVLTAIFQYGWLSGIMGLSGGVPIVSYVPLFMFAILFGLSMDYEVFLVSQIEEHVHAGEDNRSSVSLGLVTSARVITAAAAIMVFVFGSFLLNGNPTVKEFGVGLAVAVILDATVVRCLLVPSLMILMGKINWWMPRWLDRIVPQFSIEGAEFFAERDRLAEEKRAREEPQPVLQA